MGRKVYACGSQSVRLWVVWCTAVGRKVYAYGAKGVRLWGERCTSMGRKVYVYGPQGAIEVKRYFRLAFPKYKILSEGVL